jgi:phage protein
MIKGITKSGFKFEISDKALDDFELLELMADVDSNALLVPKIFEKLLGMKQKENLIEFMKKRDGYASTEKMAKILEEILLSSQKLKN